MPRCELCKEEYDPDEAKAFFDGASYNGLLIYENVRPNFCGRCALKAVKEEEWDGVYFEECELCGKTFDLVDEEFSYDRGLLAAWDRHEKILCASCASKLDEQ